MGAEKFFDLCELDLGELDLLYELDLRFQLCELDLRDEKSVCRSLKGPHP